ncbi:MAG: polyprenyl synthetase family protein [Thaumarchaeota archaeon]|nr:polyprenyl synthetase family protein [Nitrososphaerota archaeon]
MKVDFTPMLEDMGRVKKRVDGLILDELLPKSHTVPAIDLLYTMMRDYPARPGKGMRPYLCVTSCEAFGGKEDNCLLTAAAIELFQNWILIHDDIEDGSEMRRGSPALHKKYDWVLALNTGDALHARMWESLLRNRAALGESRTFDIMAEFARMIDETTEGQQMELRWVVDNDWGMSEADYYLMCTKKTSWYTVISPMRLGGFVAGAPTSSVDSLVEPGKKLGVGFQIHDDVLNLSAGSKYGKETADDLLEGKRTLILIKLLSAADPQDKARIVEIFSMSRVARRPFMGEILDLIHKYDALGYAAARSTELVNDALAMMKNVCWTGNEGAARRIEEIARFAVERDW